jgi:hypothetical protein
VKKVARLTVQQELSVRCASMTGVSMIAIAGARLVHSAAIPRLDLVNDERLRRDQCGHPGARCLIHGRIR